MLQRYNDVVRDSDGSEGPREQFQTSAPGLQDQQEGTDGGRTGLLWVLLNTHTHTHTHRHTDTHPHRKHSSRMRTACFSSSGGSAKPPVGRFPCGQTPLDADPPPCWCWSCDLWCMLGSQPLPCWQTNTRENITLPENSFAGSKYTQQYTNVFVNYSCGQNAKGSVETHHLMILFPCKFKVSHSRFS